MQNLKPSVDNFQTLNGELRPVEPPRSSSFDYKRSGPSPRERARIRYDSISAERDFMKFDRSNLMTELMKSKDANDKLHKELVSSHLINGKLNNVNDHQYAKMQEELARYQQ